MKSYSVQGIAEIELEMERRERERKEKRKTVMMREERKKNF